MIQLVILNGTSSSGKTSIATELQKILKPVWLNFSIDSVLYSLPADDLEAMIAGRQINRPEYAYSKLVSGYHRALVGLLSSENNVISDNALANREQKEELKSITKGFGVFWVGVHCNIKIAKQRELARGDRAIGTVEREFPKVHLYMDYDFEVDTSNLSAEGAAERIASALALWKGEPLPLANIENRGT